LRKLTVQAVGCARLARQKISQGDNTADASPAFWLGMLCGMKAQLDRLAALNGHSPLHGFTLTWPKWLKRLERDLRKQTGPIQRAVTLALAASDDDRAQSVTEEEQELSAAVQEVAPPG
jgi:hypothetical protein